MQFCCYGLSFLASYHGRYIDRQLTFSWIIELSKKVRKTVSTLKLLKILLYYDQTNIELHYTEAISKHRFRITEGENDTVQGRDIYSFNSPLPAIVFKIFWDFLMSYQILLSQHVKRCVYYTSIHMLYTSCLTSCQTTSDLGSYEIRKY